jgi:hypothetical protein
MNHLLMSINYERATKKTEAQAGKDEFPKFFMMLAKEMLAEQVYNRIVVAAVHRQRERGEKKAEPAEQRP